MEPTNQPPTATMNWLMLRAMVKSAMRCVHRKVAKGARPALECVYIELKEKTIVTTATNGHCLVTLEGECISSKGTDTALLRPERLKLWLAAEANELSNVAIRLGHDPVIQNGDGLVFSQSLSGEQFPTHYDDTIPMRHDDWECSGPTGVHAKYLGIAASIANDIQARGLAMQVMNPLDPIRIDYFGDGDIDVVTGCPIPGRNRLCDATMVIMPQRIW